MRQQYRIGLEDLKKYNNQNDAVQYLLVAVDSFSRRASVHLLKNKQGPSMKKGLIKLSEKLGDAEKIQFDKRLEMHINTVKDLFQKRQIHLFTSESNHVKYALAVRFLSTIKSKIFFSRMDWHPESLTRNRIQLMRTTTVLVVYMEWFPFI